LKRSEPRLLLPIVFIAIVVAAACGGDQQSGGPAPAATSTALVGYRERINDTVWEKVEEASWYNHGALSPEGLRLLDIMVSAGGLWQDSDRLALLDAYPRGIDETTWKVTGEYARMTLSTVFEVVREPWIKDGIDAYEEAVIAATEERVVTAAALRRALQDGLFRTVYQTAPESLSSLQIDAVGSLDGKMMAYLQTQPWFQDGVDSYEVSLLSVLNSIVSVDEQIALLQAGKYRRLDLTKHSIAVLFQGNSAQLQQQAFSIIQSWMPKMEEFLGSYKPTALIVDVTPNPNINFCHAGGGNEFRPSTISLPLAGCFRASILIHELAHAFIGGRYPPWFSEGSAELVTYHLTGARSGYEGGQGTIELEGRFTLAGAAYQNQAALGADFLEELYKVVGAEAISTFLQDVEGRSLTGQGILERVRQMPADRTAIDALIEKFFGTVAASPVR
jgi:hypothetical protein